MPNIQRRVTDAFRGSVELVNLRLQREQENRKKRVKSGAVWDEWWPTESEQWVLFVPSKGVPVYVNYNCYVPLKNGPRKGVMLPCRCDNERKKTPCLLHYLRAKDLAERRKDPRKFAGSKTPYYARENYAITVVLWDYYHFAPKVIQQNDETTRIRMSWVRCEDPNEVVEPDTECKICRTAAAMSRRIEGMSDDELTEEQIAWKRHRRQFGVRRYFNMGSLFYNAFISMHRRISRQCKCGGKLTVVRYVCPACRDKGITTVLMDPRTTSLGPEEQAAYWRTSVRCDAAGCGYTGAPSEIVRCNMCGDPRPRSIYDQPVCIVRTGERPAVSMEMVDIGDPIDFGALPADLRKLLEPYDFEAVFDVSTQDQANLLGIQDPFSEQAESREDRSAPVGAVDYSSGTDDIPF